VFDNFTVRVSDGHGGFADRQVSIAVNGASEVGATGPAVIGNPPVTHVTEDLNVNGSNNLTASGTIPISDPDVGQAAFNTVVTAAPGTLGSLTLAANGNYTYSVANSAVQYLGQNETKVDTFTINAVDGTPKQVNFTIHGVNDAPTASLPKHEMLEGSGLHQIDLLAGASDAEGNAISVAGVDIGGASWLTLNPDGHTISIDTNGDWFGNMSMGSTQDFNFSYTLVDSLGVSALQFGTYRIVGTDDRPFTGVDGNWTVHESGGNDPGHPEAMMRIFVSDPDWVGLGPNNVPIQQQPYADTTGWTANGGGIFSKLGVYGTLVWDTNFVTQGDGQRYATLTYHIDNDDPDTHALTSSQNVYDSFGVTYTDGTLSTTRTVNYEVVGRSDMSDASATYKVLYPTDAGTWTAGAQITTDGPATSFVTSGTTLNQITPSASLNYGNLIVLYNGADGSVHFSDEDITFTFSDFWAAPNGWTDATVLRNGDAHFGPPAPGEDWLQTIHVLEGVPWDGIEITGLPSIERVDLAPGAQNLPFIGWDEHSFRINFAGQTYQGGSQLDYIVTFRGGNAIGDPAANPNPAPVYDGATSQSIGPQITVHDSFIFDLNVPYNGDVHFEGAAGTLKFENTAFTGTISNFSDGDHLDFSAITNGNATVHQEFDGTLEAHSIGWTTDGTDTFVFVNNTGVDEAIAAADMMVKLLGVTQLHNHDVIV